ncbi:MULTISPECIES: GpE family phage tail protein [Edwardsiella]|uniref:GpE family phage tail protein n=1 Tax=Edwardsiella tarda ATCC 15947 = NBRC 105688 TaxID=667121 RepID=A0AC61TID7_EDWTA|nr:GpE family phage tail protein [Edwardsiella tarda]UAL56634.1 GpE family phage tail protein [Edwardsiella tarda]UCQ00314.1 GpE family phage tail protein [Edwardsiella tarda ATCC 15947 = NBRC 105688]
MVADIATVFNWSPADIFTMTLDDMIAWRERAAQRSGARDDNP